LVDYLALRIILIILNSHHASEVITVLIKLVFAHTAHAFGLNDVVVGLLIGTSGVRNVLDRCGEVLGFVDWNSVVAWRNSQSVLGATLSYNEVCASRTVVFGYGVGHLTVPFFPMSWKWRRLVGVLAHLLIEFNVLRRTLEAPFIL
jgi:hypothetical protein